MATWIGIYISDITYFHNIICWNTTMPSHIRDNRSLLWHCMHCHPSAGPDILNGKLLAESSPWGQNPHFITLYEWRRVGTYAAWCFFVSPNNALNHTARQLKSSPLLRRTADDKYTVVWFHFFFVKIFDLNVRCACSIILLKHFYNKIRFQLLISFFMEFLRKTSHWLRTTNLH